MKAFTLSAIVILAACSTSGDSKIEATLRMALDDPTSTGRPLPFETEKLSDGTVIVPLFIHSSDPAATAAAVKRAGGTTSTVAKDIVTARVPMAKIKALASASEVSRIEPSFALR
jgi:hypothetical protein